MALTTYLTQSVVSTLLFFGYGLGWYGTASYTQMFEITVVSNRGSGPGSSSSIRYSR